MDEERLNRLSRRDVSAGSYSAGYTKFVRYMRLILPLIAVGIVAIIFLWPNSDDEAIIPVRQNKKIFKDQHISKNELLNPKFESADKNKRPYKITAVRAVQGETNDNLIMLEKPVGVIKISDNETIRVSSLTGAYRRDTERFYLKGNVDIFHNKGYDLKSEEVHIDMKKNLAWSEKDVFGKGPDLSITAKGIKLDGESNDVVFIGPAKLVLENGIEGVK